MGKKGKYIYNMCISEKRKLKDTRPGYGGGSRRQGPLCRRHADTNVIYLGVKSQGRGEAILLTTGSPTSCRWPRRLRKYGGELDGVFVMTSALMRTTAIGCVRRRRTKERKVPGSCLESEKLSGLVRLLSFLLSRMSISKKRLDWFI